MARALSKSCYESVVYRAVFGYEFTCDPPRCTAFELSISGFSLAWEAVLSLLGFFCCFDLLFVPSFDFDNLPTDDFFRDLVGDFDAFLAREALRADCLLFL